MTTDTHTRSTAAIIGAVTWRLVGFLILWGAILAGPVLVVHGQIADRNLNELPLVRLLLESIAFGAVVLAVWVMHRFAGHSTTAVRNGGASALGHLAVGVVVGLVLMTMVVVVLAIAGTLHRVSVPLPALLALVVVCASTLLNAGTQELMFQGYVLPLFERYVGTRVAIAISAALFLLVHGPAAFTNLLPGLNLYLAGVLLASAFLATRSLWFATGLHFGWNVLEGPLLGLSVSGHDLGGWRVVDASGPSWITGGNYGPEGGFVATIVTLIGIAVLWGYAHMRVLRVRAEAD